MLVRVKNKVKDLAYFLGGVITSPILYIALIPILFLLQLVFHNIPIEALYIDGIMIGITAVGLIIKLLRYSV